MKHPSESRQQKFRMKEAKGYKGKGRPRPAPGPKYGEGLAQSFVPHFPDWNITEIQFLNFCH